MSLWFLCYRRERRSSFWRSAECKHFKPTSQYKFFLECICSAQHYVKIDFVFLQWEIYLTIQVFFRMYIFCPTLCKNWFCLFTVRNLQVQLCTVQDTIDSAGIIYYCQKGAPTQLGSCILLWWNYGWWRVLNY